MTANNWLGDVNKMISKMISNKADSSEIIIHLTNEIASLLNGEVNYNRLVNKGSIVIDIPPPEGNIFANCLISLIDYEQMEVKLKIYYSYYIDRLSILLDKKLIDNYPELLTYSHNMRDSNKPIGPIKAIVRLLNHN